MLNGTAKPVVRAGVELDRLLLRVITRRDIEHRQSLQPDRLDAVPDALRQHVEAGREEALHLRDRPENVRRACPAHGFGIPGSSISRIS